MKNPGEIEIGGKMKGESVFKSFFSNGIEAILKYFMYLGWVAIAIMALTVSTDVIGRYVFGKPLIGGSEIVEQLMTCCVLCVLPYVTKERRHITVDILALKLTPRTQRILAFISDFLMVVVLAFLTWQGFVGTMSSIYSGECTQALRIPNWPFNLILAFGFMLAFLSLLMSIIDNFISERRRF